MESNKKKNADKNQRSAPQNQKSQQNRNHSQQEQQAGHNRKHDSSQEEGGDKYLSNGYLNDKERYDDSEL